MLVFAFVIYIKTHTHLNRQHFNFLKNLSLEVFCNCSCDVCVYATCASYPSNVCIHNNINTYLYYYIYVYSRVYMCVPLFNIPFGQKCLCLLLSCFVSCSAFHHEYVLASGINGLLQWAFYEH
jgi:hypothetical protein